MLFGGNNHLQFFVIILLDACNAHETMEWQKYEKKTILNVFRPQMKITFASEKS